MTNPVLFAAAENWLSNWLTPVWIVGIGAILGLLVLVGLWLAALITSKIPGIQLINGTAVRANRSGIILSILAFVALGVAVLGPSLWGGAAGSGLVSPSNVPMVACLLAVFSCLLGFGLVRLTSQRVASEALDAVREGPLWPVGAMTAFFAIFGVAGYYVATTPRPILASLARLPVLGTTTLNFTVPATSKALLDDPSRDPPQHPIEVSFRKSELRSISVSADQNVTIDSKAAGDLDLAPLFRVDSGSQPTRWAKSSQSTLSLEGDRVTQLYVRNYGISDAHLTVVLSTAPEHPEVVTAVITAIGIVSVFLLYLLQRAAMPRLSAVALATYKSEIAQPLFLIVMAIGLFAIVAFVWIPYNTLGEDIKVLKDTGMTLIMILSIFQAVWAASTSIADEIEGRTALTVLSKPIGRASFICGKFLGIFWTVAVIFLVLGASFMVAVSYKPIYDNKEGSYKPIYEDQMTSETDITWQQCHYEMVGVTPGLVLAFLETVVLAALSVAISTRLPMLANFIICFSIYVLGHLTPLIVQSSVGKFAPVRFVAELLSTVLPILDHFNIQAAVSTGAAVPYDYLGWTLLYSMLYGVMALLLALVLFEDRDLA